VQPQTVQQQQQQQQSAGEKLRRHSDSEHFVSPRAPADVQQEAVALAELLLKRGGKVCIAAAVWEYKVYVSFIVVHLTF
jgi:predicted kinase